jgi:hypothetical protein
MSSDVIWNMELFIHALLASVIPQKRNFTPEVNSLINQLDLDSEKLYHTFFEKLATNSFAFLLSYFLHSKDK